MASHPVPPHEEDVVHASDVSHDDHAPHREHDEPDEQAGSGDPRTPMWLPFVGGITLVLAVIGFVATRPPGKTMAELQKEAAAANAELRAKREAEMAPPAPTITAPSMPMPGMPNPGMPQPGRAPGRGG
jgi:hypothetical protein